MAENIGKMKVEFIDQDESVQVVADTIRNTGEVPERYVRHEIKADSVIVEAEDYDLPIIDMSRLLNPEFSKEETAKLGSACEHWGFFQLVNHGVDGRLLQQIKSDITKFFSFPLEEKLSVAIPPKGMQGFGHHFVFSKEQKLDWVDLLFLTTRPVEERNLAFWPTEPSTFRDSLDKYSMEIANVSAQLFKFMANNLGVDQEALLDTFKGLPQCVRINYYPPCHQADKVLGLSPHTDGVGMTFLLHVNDVEGLQIRKNGKWFSVHAIPGALVVNIGDILEILTNGKYKSIEHRAVINPDKERITIATFHNIYLFCTIGPLQELLKAGEAHYKAIDGVEYTKGYFDAKLEGRSIIDKFSKTPKEDYYQQLNLGIPMAEARTIGSLPLANVQALAKTCNKFHDQIPERYIRAEASSEETITGDDSSSAIPIIDLNKLLDRQSSEEECVKLGSACKNWSFFQLINHGVPDEVIENLMNGTAKFFKQPLEAMKAYSQLPNNHEGYSQSFVVSENQKLDWSDRLFLQVHPVKGLALLAY